MYLIGVSLLLSQDSEIVANVIVSDGNFTSTSSDTFSYSSSHTLVITSLNITEASVAGVVHDLVRIKNRPQNPLGGNFMQQRNVGLGSSKLKHDQPHTPNKHLTI